MTELNNRIDAQRRILQLVNRIDWAQEPLHGLSEKALERWRAANRLEQECDLLRHLNAAAAELFFLANKSQEQVTEEYRLHSSAVTRLMEEVEHASSAILERGSAGRRTEARVDA